MDTKRCRLCDLEKPLSEFRLIRRKDRPNPCAHAWCRECEKSKHRVYEAEKRGGYTDPEHKAILTALAAYARWSKYRKEKERRRKEERARRALERKGAVTCGQPTKKSKSSGTT